MNFEAQIRAGLQELRRLSRYRELEIGTGISFVDNDYLGLSQHPDVLRAGHRALDIFGAGSRGSRLLGGHSRAFMEAESSIAAFFGAPAALFFSSGYLANLGLVTALAPLARHVVCDEKIHASTIDAVSLTRAPKTILPHNQWASVSQHLPQGLGDGPLLFLAESLYGMDGDFVARDALFHAASQGPHFVILDEAHAAGVFPEDGAGLARGWSEWKSLAVVVTFGKAFGVAGAAVLCSSELREWLVNRARAFIYTTAPSPMVPAMVTASLEVVRKESWRREEIWDRARMVRRILREISHPLERVSSDNKEAPPAAESFSSAWSEASPIIPFFVPGDDRALRFCESMRQKGIYLRAIRYPTVPRGSERVRISLGLGATRENTEIMAKELVKTWTAFFC